MAGKKKFSLLVVSFFLFAVMTGSISGLLFAAYHDLPKLRGLKDYKPDVVTKIFSEDGKLLDELFRQKRIWVPYQSIPVNLRNALVATEDREFFEHKGIRFMSILRALIIDIRKGKMVQGGSTITQQLAKQLFLTSEKTIARKIKEALLAIQIEKRYTKEEILELYCNHIYLGSGAYGFEAAARTYFGKAINDISLGEAALLGGLPKAPNRYSPKNNLNLAIGRRATVLSGMREEGYISRELELATRSERVELAKSKKERGRAGYLVEMVRSELIKKYGAEKVYREGLSVTTTLNLDYQESAEKSMKEGIEKINKRLLRKKKLKAGQSAQGALVALRPQDGAILALVGGTGFSRSAFNRVTQARRQPGSAFKPFVYLAALDTGFTAADIVIDSPISYSESPGKRAWKPVNFSKRFYGPVTLRNALERSLNVATVKLLERVGVDSVIQMSRNLGIESELAPYLSLGLGASVVTPLELTSAYASIANGGVHAKPYFIRSVTTADGEILEESVPELTDAIRPEVAYTITKMLVGVVENGTGKVAKKLQRQVAAKTGTTNDYKDAWFAGFTPGIATGVWIGLDDNGSMGKGETGGHTAGPIWTRFMAEALQNRPAHDFTPPENIVVKSIDQHSGKLATPKCRDKINEVFIVGTEPLEYCRKETEDDGRI